MENNLDKKLGDMMKLKSVLASANVNFIPPKLVLMSIIREYLFVCGKDGSRGKSNVSDKLLIVGTFLKDSITSTIPETR